MFICSHCKTVSYSKKLSIKNHERRCPSNPFPATVTYGHWKNKHHSEKTKRRLSQVAKDRKLGGYVQGSGRGKKGWYKGFFCDSSWELAYVIYCLEHDIDIKRNTTKRQYHWNGKIKNYLPDFIVSGILTEVKGFKTAQWLAKIEANPDIKVLYEQDLLPILDYVEKKYGKNFISLYE